MKRMKPFDPALLALAALLAGVVTLGASFAQTGTAQLVTSRKLEALLWFLGRTALYAALMHLVKLALARGRRLDADSRLSRMSCRAFTCAAAGALLLCWLPYAVMIWPGTVSNDSVTQLLQIFGLSPLSNGNPVLQTGLIWLCVNACKPLGADAAIALYCATQTLFMALLMGYTLWRLSRMNAPRALLALAFAFYALCPVFPTFALCVGKDANFAMATLFLALMTLSALETPREKPMSVKATVGLLVASVATAFLRNAGLYLALMMLALLLVRALARKSPQWKAPALCAGVVGCLWLTLHLLVLPGLGMDESPETEELSLPLQQVARVVVSQPEALDDAQRAAIDAVLPLEGIKSAYNGELSDRVKDLWRADATAEQKKAFFSTWLSLVKSCPATCFSATFHNVFGYLCPGYLFTALKPTFLLGDEYGASGLEGRFDFTVNPRAERLEAKLKTLEQNPIFRLWIAPGLYGCLALFALTIALRNRGSGSALALLPALFTLLGCLLSAVNAYMRYAMPLYIAAPFALALAARALSEDGRGKEIIR